MYGMEDEIQELTAKVKDATKQIQELTEAYQLSHVHVLELQGFYGLVCKSEKDLLNQVQELKDQVEAWKQAAKDWEAKSAMLYGQLTDAKTEIRELEAQQHNSTSFSYPEFHCEGEVMEAMQLRHAKHGMDPNRDVPGEC